MNNLPKMLPTSDHGPLFFNVIDFGAKGNGSQDDCPAFQAAVDAAFAAQTKNTGISTIYVPQSSWGYLFGNSLFMDKPNMRILGGDGKPTIVCNVGCPAIYIGVKRKTPASGMCPDAFGVLDSATCTAVGQKYGIHLLNDQLQFHSNSFQYGSTVFQPGTTVASGKYDYWTDTTTITLEMFIDIPSGQTFTLGLGMIQESHPFYFQITGTHFSLLFNTGNSDRDAIRAISGELPAYTTPQRLTIQLNLNEATFLVLCNDVSIATTYSDFSTQPTSPFYDKPWGPGLTFTPNDSVPFTINASGSADITIYGLRISNIIRYTDPGLGNTLSQNQIPTDSQRYFTNDNNTVGLLDFNSIYKDTQFVSFVSPGVSGNTIRVNQTDIVSNGWIGLENLNIQGSSYAGQVVSIGADFGVNLKSLNVLGQTPIGSYDMGCTYPVYIDDCQLGGNDCALFGFEMIIYARNLLFGNGGRDIIRCVSCDGVWENIFVGAASTDTVFKFLYGQYGSKIVMRNVIIDFEGYTVNTAIVLCENCAYVPMTCLKLSNFAIGTVGACPVIILRDMGPPFVGGTWNKAWIEADIISTKGQQYSTFLQTDGTLWGGTVNAYFLPQDSSAMPLHTHINKWGTSSNVTFTNTGPYTVVYKDQQGNIVTPLPTATKKPNKKLNKFLEVMKSGLKKIGGERWAQSTYNKSN